MIMIVIIINPAEKKIIMTIKMIVIMTNLYNYNPGNNANPGNGQLPPLLDPAWQRLGNLNQ